MMMASLQEKLATWLAVVALALSVPSAVAQTSLTAGQIAVVEVNQNSGESVQFVTLTNLEAGTTFRLTDNGYTSSGSFNTNEGIYEFTAAAAMPAGTVFSYSSTSLTSEWASVSGNLALANGGDNIFLYQGTEESPNFVYGFMYGSTWDSTYTTGTSSSSLPAGLTDGSSALALTDGVKNALYMGVTSGTTAELQSALSTSSDWTQSSTEISGTSPSSFTVTDAEDPGTPAPSTGSPTPAPVPLSVSSIKSVRDTVTGGTTGGTVLVQGVVTNDLRSSTRRGFFMQMTKEDADADTSSTSSEGIFVYCGYNCNAGTVFTEGDFIQLEADTAEYNDRPQLVPSVISTGTVSVLESDKTVTVNNVLGAALAAEVNVPEFTLPVDDLSTAYASAEDMLVAFTHDMTIGDTYGLRYGTLGISQGGRIYAETMVVNPGDEAVAQADLNARRLLKLDDGSSTSCPVPQAWPVGGDDSIRSGTVIAQEALQATAIIRFEYDYNTLVPTQTGLELMKSTWDVSPVARVADIDPYVPSNDISVGRIRVGGLNVENYFTDFVDDGCSSCRGADNETEFIRQRTKIFLSAVELDAAIFGLQEVENNQDVTLANFVDGLNTQAGVEGKWEYIATGTIGGDVIKCAIIYQPELVIPVGDHAVLVYTDPVDKSRPSLAQTFRLVNSDELFTIVVQHLKSKGSACDEDSPVTSDHLEGEGNCGYTRLKHVQQLLEWLEENPTGEDTDQYILLGDFNSHRNDRSIKEFTESAGFISLADRDIAEPFSYVYDGSFSTLDYFLISPNLNNSCGNAYEWHINSPESALIDYQSTQYSYPAACESKPASYFDITTPYRGSDHDPMLGVCNFAVSSIAPTSAPVGPRSPTGDEDASSKSNTGTIVGAVVGSVGGLALLAAAAMCLLKLNASKKSSSNGKIVVTQEPAASQV